MFKHTFCDQSHAFTRWQNAFKTTKRLNMDLWLGFTDIGHLLRHSRPWQSSCIVSNTQTCGCTFQRRVSLVRSTQSTVQPVPTRHRRYACIIMWTALPANMKTWPDVVSMLVQRRWRWADSETALGQILAFAGLHTGVCLNPPLPQYNILASRSGYF